MSDGRGQSYSQRMMVFGNEFFAVMRTKLDGSYALPSLSSGLWDEAFLHASSAPLVRTA